MSTVNAQVARALERLSGAEEHRRARELRSGRAILWFGALAPFIYTTPRTVAEAAGIAPIDLVRGGGPIICFLWIALSPRFREFRTRVGAAEYALFGFVAVALASTLWTEFSPQAALLKAVQLLFMYLCVVKLVATYDDFTAVLRASLHVVHLILLGTLVQLVVAPGITYSSSDPGADPVARLHSTIPAISSNLLGVVIGAGLIGLVLQVGPDWATTTLARWPLVAIYGGMLIATRSRTILAAVAVALVVSGLIAMWRSAVAFVSGILVICCGIAYFVWFFDEAATAQLLDFFVRGQSTTGLTTLTGRTVIWSEALRYWELHPWFGGGYYTGHRFALADFNPLFRSYSNIDSTWIESLVDVGVVGATLLLAFVLRGTWQLLRVDTDRYSKVTALAIWAAIVVVSLINPGLQSATMSAVLAAVLVFGSTGRLRAKAVEG